MIITDKIKHNIIKFAENFQTLPSGSYYLLPEKEIVLTIGNTKNEILVKNNIYIRAYDKSKFTYEGIVYFILWAMYDSLFVVDRDNFAIRECADTFQLSKKAIMKGVIEILPITKVDRINDIYKKLLG